MKSILYSLLFLLIPTVLFSQTPAPASKIIHLDSLWRETSEDNYKYIRVIKDYYSEKNSYDVNDFYKSGTLQMAGTSTNKDYLQKEGQFVYYYENGKKKSTTTYVETKQTGKEYNWYENGNLKSEIEYLKDAKELSINYKINQFWNQDGKQKIIDGNGDYKNSDKIGFEEGLIKNGLRDGQWKGFINDLKINFIEIYKNGKLISGNSIDANKIEYSYTLSEEKPQPEKGIQHFYKHIGNYLNIPKEAGIRRISGKIYLTFVIDTDGKIIETKIIRGLGYGLDEEAMRVVNNYKNWIPGKRKGKKVRVSYALPITVKAPY